MLDSPVGNGPHPNPLPAGEGIAPLSLSPTERGRAKKWLDRRGLGLTDSRPGELVAGLGAAGAVDADGAHDVPVDSNGHPAATAQDLESSDLADLSQAVRGELADLD